MMCITLFVAFMCMNRQFYLFFLNSPSLRDVAAQVNVMDKRDGRQAKKSVRKRESSFVSSLYSRIVHVRYSLLAACVCIFT